MILTLAVCQSSASADCESDFSRFKVCPKDLPDAQNLALLCRDGCYLFHPEDERAARYNAKRAALVPLLEVSLDELRLLTKDMRSQRDAAIEDVATFKSAFREAEADNEDLRRRLEESFDAGDLVVSAASGFGAGLVVAGLAALILALSP